MSQDNPTVCFVSLYAYAYFASDRELPTGGAERQLYLLAQQLSSEFDIHFIVGDFGQPQRLCREGMTLHRAYEPAADGSVRVRAQQLLGLLGAMRRVDAELYVFRGDRTRAVVVGLLARLMGKRWIYNIALDSHAKADTDGFVRPMERLFSRAVQNADHVIAQTPSQQADLRKYYDVDSTVVANGYPPADAVPSFDDREFFLYVGRINGSQKRTHQFIELARRLPEQEFVLIGPKSDDEAYYSRITDEADSLDNLRFLGQVDPETVHDYFRRAIGLVNTSTQEGFPNTFLEAWRVATPVLSLDVDPQRFLDGESRGHADGEFDRLVSLAERLATSESYRRTLGEAGRRCFEDNYHISATSQTYADILSTHTQYV